MGFLVGALEVGCLLGLPVGNLEMGFLVGALEVGYLLWVLVGLSVGDLEIGFLVGALEVGCLLGLPVGNLEMGFLVGTSEMRLSDGLGDGSEVTTFAASTSDTVRAPENCPSLLNATDKMPQQITHKPNFFLDNAVG